MSFRLPFISKDQIKKKEKRLFFACIMHHDLIFSKENKNPKKKKPFFILKRYEIILFHRFSQTLGNALLFRH